VIYVFIIFEHVLLIVNGMISWVVEDIPKSVQNAMEMKKTITEKMVSQMIEKLNSNTQSIIETQKTQDIQSPTIQITSTGEETNRSTAVKQKENAKNNEEEKKGDLDNEPILTNLPKLAPLPGRGKRKTIFLSKKLKLPPIKPTPHKNENVENNGNIEN